MTRWADEHDDSPAPPLSEWLSAAASSAATELRISAAGVYVHLRRSASRTPDSPDAPHDDPDVRARSEEEEVRAPAVGIVQLGVSADDMVDPGSTVATIRMHQKDVPVTAHRGGRVVTLMVSDGEFVEYGQPLVGLAADTMG